MPLSTNRCITVSQTYPIVQAHMRKLEPAGKRTLVSDGGFGLTDSVLGALWRLVKSFFLRYNGANTDCVFVIDEEAKTVTATEYETLPVLFYHWTGSWNRPYRSQRRYGLSMDLERANLDKLRAVFPECFNQGKLDIDKLLGLCGEYIDNDFEKYRFEWKGKAECLRLAANLLRDDGVVFISIDDNEVDNLKKICNEVLVRRTLLRRGIGQTKCIKS